MLPGEVATPLAVVLNELMQNAVDHAFPADDGRLAGTVTVRLGARRTVELEVDVVDDGVGLPPGFTLEQSAGLGLSIVQALVTSELGGIDRAATATTGTRVHLTRARCQTIDRRAVLRTPVALERQLRDQALLGEPALRSLRRSSSVVPPQMPGLLVGGEGELEALLVDGAGGADPPGRLDLLERGPRAPDREEHVGIGVATRRAVRHAVMSQSWVRTQVSATPVPPVLVVAAGERCSCASSQASPGSTLEALETETN